MPKVPDGQLIEAVLYHLDSEPIINPDFSCPAVSIAQLAAALGISPALIDSRQVVDAIAPLAETLFPTPRVPVPRAFEGERWIVFEERGQDRDNHHPGKGLGQATSISSTTTQDQEKEQEQKRIKRRTTLKSYHSLQSPHTPHTSQITSPLPPIPPTPKSGGLRKLRLPTSRPTSYAPFPPLPSAPLRKTSSGELVLDIGLPAPHSDIGNGQPVSAGGKGKKSFLRPFLLGGKRNRKPDSPVQVERPVLAELNHVQQQPPGLDMDQAAGRGQEQGHEADIGVVSAPETGMKTKTKGIVDEYLHVELPESPYEETAFISLDDPPQPSNKGAVTDTAVLNIAVSIPPKEVVPRAMTPIIPRVAQLRGDTPPSPAPSPTPLGSSRISRPSTPSAAEVELPPTPISAYPTLLSPVLTPISPPPGSSSPPLPGTPVSPWGVASPVKPSSRGSREERRSEHDRHGSKEDRGTRSSSRDKDKGRERERERETGSSSKSKSRSKARHEPEERSSRSRHHEPGYDPRPGSERDDERRKRHRQQEDRSARSSRSSSSSKHKVKETAQDRWLEVTLQDLPFGPDKQMFRALESIKRDWKVFVAELVGLMALAYVVQASGW